MISQSIQKITTALFALGALLFLSVLVLTVTNIGMRAFDSSLRGAVELTGFLGAAALGLCLPHIQFQKAHANAGIFYTRLGATTQTVLRIFVSLLCFAITVACTRELMDLTLFTHEGMEVVDGFDIPSAYFMATLALGCAGQCLVLSLDILHIIQKFLMNIRQIFIKTPALAYKGK